MRRVLLAGLMLLAGCSGSTGPKMAELSELPASIPVRTLWQASVGEAGDAILFPALAVDGVYAAAQDGTVARFEASTGRESWRVNVERILSGGVGSDGTLVAVGTFDGEVIALDARSGEVRWRARVSSEVLSAPLVTGDLVIVRSADGRLFALDAKDGKRRWLYQRSSPPLSVRSPVGMVADRGQLLTGFAGGKLVSIALANGSVRWETTVALPRGATELERVTDVVGLPIAKCAPRPTMGGSGASSSRTATRSGRVSCRAPRDWRSTRVTSLSATTKARCTPWTAPAARQSGSRIACS